MAVAINMQQGNSRVIRHGFAPTALKMRGFKGCTLDLEGHRAHTNETVVVPENNRMLKEFYGGPRKPWDLGQMSLQCARMQAILMTSFVLPATHSNSMNVSEHHTRAMF